ncbi:uncharacterized protein ARMOST_19034 [Armillaria ostoyae]|uniref:Uncharacterized protein n=1 Tax=Armillaria ostoyae TaxID=47428 RepID=A0A284S3E8_ARMOS|nr:uncharacterized protein ARMOST_19034 [Armillaria ostoyae]
MAAVHGLPRRLVNRSLRTRSSSSKFFHRASWLVTTQDDDRICALFTVIRSPGGIYNGALTRDYELVVCVLVAGAAANAMKSNGASFHGLAAHIK